MNTIIKLFFSFLLLSLFFSCDNEINEIENEANVQARSLSETPFDVSSYCQEGNVLLFNDKNHFKLAYDFIDSNLDKKPNLVENLFSECGSYESSFAKLLNDQFASFEEAYKPIVADPVILALVNEHYELQLGDNLIAFISNTQALAFPAIDIATRDKVRALNMTNSITGKNIPNGTMRIFSDDPENIVNEAALKFLGPFCDCDAKIEYVDCCEVLITGECQDFIWSAGDGTISWGIAIGGTVINQNTPITILQNGQVLPIGSFFTNEERVNGSFEFSYNFCEDFPPFTQPEVVHIVVGSQADCFVDNGDHEILTINFQDGSTCDSADNDSGWLWTSVGNTRGFSRRTVAFQTREFSQIISKRWNGSAWIRSDADLFVDIAADRRNSGQCGNIDLCTVVDDEYEPKDCDDCDYKRAQIRVNNFLGNPPTCLGGGVGRCTGDVVGNFRLTSGITTVDDSIILDFDCCQ